MLDEPSSLIKACSDFIDLEKWLEILEIIEKRQSGLSDMYGIHYF